MKRKIEALKTRVDEDVRRAEARGDEPKDMTKRSRPMEPLASFDKEGKLTWNEKLVKSIEELAKDTGKGGSAKGGGAEQSTPPLTLLGPTAPPHPHPFPPPNTPTHNAR